MKDKKPDINVLAPIHGNSPAEYGEYMRNILEIEKKEKFKFSGFAIGGLGNPNKIDKTVWDILEESNGKVKAALYLMKIASIIREILEKEEDTRPIHILGSAAPYNLIPLIFVGCDTFDCHSAWRRASDGNELSKECVFDKEKLKKYLTKKQTVSFSKLLVPLLNTELQPIEENKNKFLEFIDINEYDFKCNCRVCNSISVNDLKKLYCGDQEENYYAKVLIYLHSVLQYDYICEKFRTFKKVNEFQDFIGFLPECTFKANMKEVMFPSNKGDLAFDPFSGSGGAKLSDFF